MDIFRRRHFTCISYSYLSEYSPPPSSFLLPTLFQNLSTTLSDEDFFMTKISTPPENPTTFYLPYYCPSAQDTCFKESHKVSRLIDKDSRYSEYLKNAGDTNLARIKIIVMLVNRILKSFKFYFLVLIFNIEQKV
jgi:hypothetical protein